MNRIYLDYNATSPLSHEVKKFFIEQLEVFANASSLHEDGRKSASAIHTAREQVASLINVLPETIYFTSGGSESNNTVFSSMIKEQDKSGRRVIVTSVIEHPCVLESVKYLETLGFKIIYVGVDEFGIIKMDEYEAALAQRPLLVSIMAANNEIGSVQDIKRLAELAHEARALFHTDAVQAAGKIPVDLTDWDVDYATLSGHKVYAPKGVGALYVKKGTPLTPFIRGGHQENGLRAGTYNTPAITAFGLACELAKTGLQSYMTHTATLKNALQAGLEKAIPNIKINGHPQKNLP
ncbi:MAG: cysteine desulfurase family protein, partial [Treponemataceae bacterium]